MRDPRVPGKGHRRDDRSEPLNPLLAYPSISQEETKRAAVTIRLPVARAGLADISFYSFGPRDSIAKDCHDRKKEVHRFVSFLQLQKGQKGTFKKRVTMQRESECRECGRSAGCCRCCKRRAVHTYFYARAPFPPPPPACSGLGPQGPQGPQGHAGAQGGMGATGSQGPQGLPGSDPLFVGPQGAQGRQGDTGDRGPQGPQGGRGRQGPAGITAGPQGRQGAQGPQGTRGYQGVQGNDGPQGHQGARGPQAHQGIQGARGRQGPVGYQGVQGRQGHQGPQGPQGPWGSIGFQGLEGSDTALTGSQGPRGAQGEHGPEGPPSGAHGPQGPQGAQGAQGPQGDRGRQGAQGPQGVQGPQAPIGSSGAPGPQGAMGAQGPQGPQGLRGWQGAQGLQGADTPPPTGRFTPAVVAGSVVGNATPTPVPNTYKRLGGVVYVSGVVDLATVGSPVNASFRLELPASIAPVFAGPYDAIVMSTYAQRYVGPPASSSALGTITTAVAGTRQIQFLVSSPFAASPTGALSYQMTFVDDE